MYPFGLNDNIKGFGNISLFDLSTSDTNNTPYFTIPQNRRKSSHGYRNRAKTLRILRNSELYKTASLSFI